MKPNVKTTPYFRAYPLKALNQSQPASEKQSSIHTKRAIGRFRIMPMTDPYSEKTISINKIKLPRDIAPGGDNWFNNYE